MRYDINDISFFYSQILSNKHIEALGLCESFAIG